MKTHVETAWLDKPPKTYIYKRIHNKFIKSLATSLASTGVDFLSSIVFVSAGVYYVTATSIGGICGAVASFFLSRIWVIQKKTGNIRLQFIKFVFTNFFSIVLNKFGVYYICETFNFSFVISRFLVASLVGIFFNYFMFRYFVFKK